MKRIVKVMRKTEQVIQNNFPKLIHSSLLSSSLYFWYINKGRKPSVKGSDDGCDFF